jgi:hypothetical protein
MENLIYIYRRDVNSETFIASYIYHLWAGHKQRMRVVRSWFHETENCGFVRKYSYFEFEVIHRVT